MNDLQYAVARRNLDGDTVAVFHTHGMRQYKGTAKIHRTPLCPALAHRRKPRSLSLTIMVEDDTPQFDWIRCERCVQATPWTFTDVDRMSADLASRGNQRGREQ